MSNEKNLKMSGAPQTEDWEDGFSGIREGLSRYSGARFGSSLKCPASRLLRMHYNYMSKKPIVIYVHSNRDFKPVAEKLIPSKLPYGVVFDEETLGRALAVADAFYSHNPNRVIIAGRDVMTHEGKLKDITESLARVLNPKTTLYFITRNGEGQDFVESLPADKRRFVRVVSESSIETLLQRVTIPPYSA